MVAAHPLQHDQQPEEPQHMSEAEYLAYEEATAFKHEFSNGRIIAMTGGSLHHGLITVNISTQLNIKLADTDCGVVSPDIRVAVRRETRSAYRYPDVTVYCGEPAFLEGRKDTLTNPVLLVEVLSPSTILTDINQKLEEYTQIESLQAYLLVAQDQAKVERYQRHESDQWLYQLVTGLDGEVSIPTLELTLSLAQIYRRVTFDQDDQDNPNESDAGDEGEEA